MQFETENSNLSEVTYGNRPLLKAFDNSITKHAFCIKTCVPDSNRCIKA